MISWFRYCRGLSNVSNDNHVGNGDREATEAPELLFGSIESMVNMVGYRRVRPEMPAKMSAWVSCEEFAANCARLDMQRQVRDLKMPL